MPSVSEIAQRAGVAKSTVSLALNNRRNVSEATRKKVLQALEELRRESPPPSATRNGTQSYNVLLIHPETLYSSQVFRETLQGIQIAIDETNSRLTLAVHQSPLHANHATHILLHDPTLRPDGALVVGAQINDPILDEIRAEKLPCVLLARQEGADDVSIVGMDNIAGMREATQYLIDLGHRCIAFVGGATVYDFTELRRKGYEAAMAAANLPTEGLTFLGSGDEAIRDFLNAKTGATAVVFINDEYAQRAYPVLNEAGIRIPDDLSITGFDDTNDARLYSPPLTTLTVQRDQIGYWAARVLVEHIRNPNMMPMRLIMRPRLNIRESCRAIKE